MLIYFAPGLDRAEFHNICIAGTAAVGVPVLMRHTKLSRITVSLVLRQSNRRLSLCVCCEGCRN